MEKKTVESKTDDEAAEKEMDSLWLEIFPAAASQFSCLHGVDGDGDGGDVGAGNGSSVMPPQDPELGPGHGNWKEPVLLIDLTSNMPSSSLRSTSASNRNGPSMAVDGSCSPLVTFGLIPKGVDGNENAPVSPMNLTSNVLSSSLPRSTSASKLLFDGSSVAVGDSCPRLPASGLMAKGADGNEKAAVSPLNLTSNVPSSSPRSTSSSKLLSGGPSWAVGDSSLRLLASASRMEATSRDEKGPVSPSLGPPSSPSSTGSSTRSGSARLAPAGGYSAHRPAVAAGFVIDTGLANELDRVHLGDDPEGAIGLSVSESMNIPTNPSRSQTAHGNFTTMESFYSSKNGAYYIPSNSLFYTDRIPNLAQFQQQFSAQGILPNPQLGNLPIREGEWRRGPLLGTNSHNSADQAGYFASTFNQHYPMPTMFSLPENSRSNPGRRDDAPSRLKYRGIYEEPRRAIIVRNDLILQRWRRPYYTRGQWIDLFGQIDRQLQAKGFPVKVSALLLRHYDGRPVDVKDAMYCIAQNKFACLVLQDKLKEGPDMVEMILDGVIDHATELMSDASGNYFMQNLMEVSSQEQLMEILLVVKRCAYGLIELSLNNHGTRSVQALIRSLENKQQISWVMAALRPGLLRLMNDPNGSHVVQTCLTYLTPDENAFIFEAATVYCVDISTHQFGCVTIQHCINYAMGGIYQQKLVLGVVANAYQLARHQFGNYVVQYVLRRTDPTVAARFAFQFSGRYVELSKNKYASNVVEKCLEKFNDHHKNEIIVELLSHPFGLLMQDPFANYVIQAACRRYEGPLRGELEATIIAHRGLASSPYCKGIFSKLKS